MLANVVGSLAILLVGALFSVLLFSERAVRRLEEYARTHTWISATAMAFVLVAVAVALCCIDAIPLNSGPAGVVHGG